MIFLMWGAFPAQIGPLSGQAASSQPCRCVPRGFCISSKNSTHGLRTVGASQVASTQSDMVSMSACKPVAAAIDDRVVPSPRSGMCPSLYMQTEYFTMILCLENAVERKVLLPAFSVPLQRGAERLGGLYPICVCNLTVFRIGTTTRQRESNTAPPTQAAALGRLPEGCLCTRLHTCPYMSLFSASSERTGKHACKGGRGGQGDSGKVGKCRKCKKCFEGPYAHHIDSIPVCPPL